MKLHAPLTSSSVFIRCAVAVFLSAVFSVSSASAGVNTDGISYQGRLADALDNPVPDGPKDLTLSIWTDSIGGTMLHSELVVVVTSKGLFTTCLGCGSTSFPSLFAGQSLFLQTQLAGDPPMAPRTRLRSAPFSISSSSVHGESSNGVARARGIIANKPGTGVGRVGFVTLLDVDADGNGVTDMSAETEVDNDSASFRLNGLPPGTPHFGNLAMSASGSGAHQVLSGRSGSTTGTIRMAANSGGGPVPPSDEILLEADLDGDGVMDRSITDSVDIGGARRRLKSSGIGSSGNDGVEVSLAALPTGGSFRAINTKGTGATVRSCSGSADSVAATVLLEADLDGDGVMENTITDSVDASGAQRKLKSSGIGSSGNDGVEISLNAQPNGGTLRAINTKGTGEKLRTIMEASDSAVSLQESDANGNGHPEARGIIAVKSGAGAGSASNRMTYDSNDDGVADMSAEMEANADSASFRLNGLPPGTPYIGNLSMSASGGGAHQVLTGHSGSTTGTIRMAASPDSAVFDLGYTGSTTGTIRLQANSSGSSNPIEHSSGAHLTAGGVWTNASDRNLKENFRPVDGSQILEKIEELPISKWNYKTESPDVSHIGPTAQDFMRVFGVGENDKTISTIDPSGIALAAIKALNQKINDQAAENQDLRAQIAQLREMIRAQASKQK